MCWTPSLESCLERGGQYAWSVRAEGTGGASEWSALRLFAVVAQGVADAQRVADAGAAGPEDVIEGRREEPSAGEAPEDADTPPGRPSPSEEVSAKGTLAGTLLSVGGGIEATTLDTAGAITSAGSLSLDGTTDTIIAAGGTLSFADEDLITTGTTTTANLSISGLDCSGNANGGALTASATGVVSCSDDEVGQIAPQLPRLRRPRRRPDRRRDDHGRPRHQRRRSRRRHRHPLRRLVGEPGRDRDGHSGRGPRRRWQRRGDRNDQR